jgi:hypothetical protein
VVAVEARKAAQQRGATAPPVEATPRRQQVVSLTERRLADLPGDDRPLPSVDAYDDLLGKAGSSSGSAPPRPRPATGSVTHRRPSW